MASNYDDSRSTTTNNYYNDPRQRIFISSSTLCLIVTKQPRPKHQHWHSPIVKYSFLVPGFFCFFLGNKLSKSHSQSLSSQTIDSGRRWDKKGKRTVDLFFSSLWIYLLADENLITLNFTSRYWKNLKSDVIIIIASWVDSISIYLSFFFGLKLLVWPHFFLRQLTALGCKRA